MTLKLSKFCFSRFNTCWYPFGAKFYNTSSCSEVDYILFLKALLIVGLNKFYENSDQKKIIKHTLSFNIFVKTVKKYDINESIKSNVKWKR